MTVNCVDFLSSGSLSIHILLRNARNAGCGGCSLSAVLNFSPISNLEEGVGVRLAFIRFLQKLCAKRRKYSS